MSISYLRVAQSRQFQGGSRRQREAAGRDTHDEEALDEALAESFPASDPVAVDITTAVPGAGLRHTLARDTPS